VGVETGDQPGDVAVALVTGAGGGLGRACALDLAGAGRHVVVSDVEAEAAAATAGEVEGAGGSAASIALDVSDRAAVEEAVRSIVDSHGRLDIVVNLAGVIRNQLLVKIEDDDFDLVLATHVRGTLNTMRAAIPHMRERGYGRIVNTSSLAARGSIAGASYGAAKGAIEGLTRSAAIEVARYGITVNCVAPGLIAAGMFLTVPQSYQEESAAKIPMQRLGLPEEVAACVSFLASPAASYVTGQTLLICGGLSLGF
jgi:NAD(P)-dependent dehydrogenase (short-subunit alcohol dehydrogenase family)